MLGEVIAFGQLDHVEPLVEQKVDITPGEELRDVGQPFGKSPISDRSFNERSLIMGLRSTDVNYV